MIGRECCFVFFLLLREVELNFFFVARFERYPEDNAAATYGKDVPDPHGAEFPDFEYAC